MHPPFCGFYFLCAAAVLVCGPAGCVDDTTFEPLPFNFHAIEEGQAYRSAQPSGPALSWVVDRYGIKTVINLRGPNPGKLWYDEEADTCREKGVVLVDLPMSSQSLPPPALLEAIVTALRTAEYPILIHCESGSDRTGAVSALYRLDVLEQPRAEALAELGPGYWHFAESKPCMDKLVELYQSTAEWMAQYARDYDLLSCN